MSCVGRDSVTGKKLLVTYSIGRPNKNLGVATLDRTSKLCSEDNECSTEINDQLIVSELPIDHVTLTALEQNAFAPYHHPGDISEYAKIHFERPGLVWLATPGNKQRIEFWYGRIDVSTQWVNWYEHQYVDCISE